MTGVARDLSGPAAWPRISVVTAVFNSVQYLEQTIQSVVAQGYPNLEYIIVDGGSSDGSVEIIRKYERHLAWWISEPDGGHFDALNKGFAHSTGEVLGWINASDQLHVGGLRVVGSVFQAFPQVEWLTGLPTDFNEEGATVEVERLPHWSRFRFLAGANHWIQQESTYWRRTLWARAGGRVDASRRVFSDLELWVRFFRYARLYSVNALVGGYRHHADAASALHPGAADRVYDEVIEAELRTLRWGPVLRAFRAAAVQAQRIPKVRGAWRLLVTRALYHLPGPDWPPVIEYRAGRGWIMRST